MTIAQPLLAPPVVEAPTTVWRRHLLALAFVEAALLLLFASDAADMAGIWWNSSTFGHCLLIPPIIAWLVWQRIPELRRLAPRAWSPGLGLVTLGALSWLLGDAAGVALARHLGLVLMMQGAVIACLGPAVARGLMFPLGYALFLVPAGEELVPPLQTLTARMSMALLDLADVPAHIEGVFISIPNGWFEVAEACSGVKFLVAMLAFGALAANLCFRSWPRRIAFMAAAAAVPILANGLRAAGTIYVSHLTSSDFAVGFDHVVYGWIFFAIVLIAVMAAGWPFFDRAADDPWFDPARLQSSEQPAIGAGRVAGTAGAAVLLGLLALGWTAAVAADDAPLSNRMALPSVTGWERVTAEPDWRPHFKGADHLLTGRYRDGRGRTVDLAIAFFARQAEGKELVGHSQGAIGPESPWAWTDDRAPPPGGRASRISAPGPVVREVVTFYRVGGVTTGSDARVKLETVKARLLGSEQRAVALLVSAKEERGRSARPAIDAFLRALGPVDRVADRAAGL
jgi:exosortase A